MSKVSKVVIDGVTYDVSHLTADTLGEFVVDVPRYKLDEVLKKYDIKKSK
jgi:hypothetical protein